MSRVCFLAVVLDHTSAAQGGVEAYATRVAKRAGATLLRADPVELGASFGAGVDHVAMIGGGGGPEPSCETVRSCVRALLAATDVLGVRVGWWHFGARKRSHRRAERIDVVTLGSAAWDEADWDAVFTIEVRRAPREAGTATLRELALGIA